jgi:hypothetical protein
VDEYLAGRKAKGFTALQVHVLPWLDEIGNANGELPLLDLDDLATPNEKFFARTEVILDRAQRAGFLVTVAPAWLAGRWRDVMKANGIEKTRTFGRYLGKRFSRFPKILWILGGDRNPGEHLTLVRALAEGIREMAPQHLMTAHPGSPYSAMEVYGDEKWLDVNCTYTLFA